MREVLLKEKQSVRIKAIDWNLVVGKLLMRDRVDNRHADPPLQQKLSRSHGGSGCRGEKGVLSAFLSPFFGKKEERAGAIGVVQPGNVDRAADAIPKLLYRKVGMLFAKE